MDRCLFLWMIEDYRVYLENLSVPSFLRLMEDARQTIESFKETVKSSKTIRSKRMKRPRIAVVEKSKGSKGSKGLPSSDSSHQTFSWSSAISLWSKKGKNSVRAVDRRRCHSFAKSRVPSYYRR